MASGAVLPLQALFSAHWALAPCPAVAVFGRLFANGSLMTQS
jgi:hypothetical protein